MMQNTSSEKENNVFHALNVVGLVNRIETLEEGINTMMLKEFSEKGIDISGGERQKIAIARAFANNYRCIILDEPNSSLDIVSESIIYKNIIKYTKNKNLLIISHRLNVTRLVDKILVMENGKIVEEGNHQELMNRNGLYSYMFRVQAQKYHRD